MLGDNGEIILLGNFLPMAERFGLISQIDWWVAHLALGMLIKYPKLKLFINLSGVSMGDVSLFDIVEKGVINSGLNKSRIGFEITSHMKL